MLTFTIKNRHCFVFFIIFERKILMSVYIIITLLCSINFYLIAFMKLQLFTLIKKLISIFQKRYFEFDTERLSVFLYSPKGICFLH